MSSARLPGNTCTLIIGYGNVSRRDDGVAYHIVQRLDQRLGGATRDAAKDGESDLESEVCLGQGLTAIFLHQLAPELAETVAQYDRVVFVDAHVDGAGWEPVHWQEVLPAYQASLVGHNLSPSSVVALAQSLYGRSPRAYVLSVLGVDFDFGEELSAETSARADQAVERLLALLQASGAS